MLSFDVVLNDSSNFCLMLCLTFYPWCVLFSQPRLTLKIQRQVSFLTLCILSQNIRLCVRKRTNTIPNYNVSLLLRDWSIFSVKQDIRLWIHTYRRDGFYFYWLAPVRYGNDIRNILFKPIVLNSTLCTFYKNCSPVNTTGSHMREINIGSRVLGLV